MAHRHLDGVADTTTTTGTGNITCANSPPTGFRTFQDAVSTGDTFYYFIRHRSAAEWEAGLGTKNASSHVIERTTVINSSNSDSAVSFAAGTKDVFISSIGARDNPRLSGLTDNRLVRTDGTNGNLQQSGITISDADAVSGVASIVDGSSVPFKKAGVETIYVPAGAMVARTTNGAASGTVETTTNKVMLKTLDFDTSTQEFAQFSIRMPKSWNESTITAVFTWSHASTSTNFGVVWALEAVALSDDDASDTAFGTAQQIADTGGTTNDIYVTSATPAITIGNSPAAEDWVAYQVKRVPSDGSDTMAIDARLHGVTLYVTTDAANDA